MEHKFLHYVMQLTLFLTLPLFLLVNFYDNVDEALGVVLGSFWGLINLSLLKKTLHEWLKINSRNHLKLFILLQIKFPILYFFGYALLRLKIFSVVPFLLGFSLIFISIFILGLMSRYQSSATTVL